MPIYNPPRRAVPTAEVLAASKLHQKNRKKRQATAAGGKCEHCEDKVDIDTLEPVWHDTVSDLNEKWCQNCISDDAFACEGGCDRVYDNDVNSPTTVTRGRRGHEETWCESCSEETAACESCDNVVPSDEVAEVRVRSGRRNNKDTWCNTCCEGDTFMCRSCDELCKSDLSAGEVDGDEWCSPCYENAGAYCEDHDYQYSSFCPMCEEAEEDSLIHKYHSAQDTGFSFIESPWVESQPKPIYFGVELEVEVPSGKPLDDYAQKIRDTMGPLLAGMEKDGSLSHGFEIVTEPAGLDTHREHWSETNLKGLKSHDTSTCGLHIHVTREAISKLTLGKILQFTYAENNRTFMETLARRSFVSYAKRIAGMKISEGVKPRKERYEAWNTTNDDTVEFRLPKGTTKVTTILATVEFVFAIIRFCEEASAEDLTTENFKRFIAQDHWLADTRFLRPYLVDRGLAVAKEMRLPKIKPGTPSPVNDAPLENPSSDSYSDMALDDYLEHGEHGTALIG